MDDKSEREEPRMTPKCPGCVSRWVMRSPTETGQGLYLSTAAT